MTKNTSQTPTPTDAAAPAEPAEATPGPTLEDQQLPDGAPEDSEFDFAKFSDEDLDTDDGDDGDEQEEQEPVTPAEPTAPEDTKESATAEATPPAQEPQSQQEPQTPAEGATPTGEPQQPAEADLNAQYKQFFDSSVEQLSNEVYRLDDETKEKLDTSPSEVIPRLAATLHMQVLTATVTQLANLLPQMIPQISEQDRANREAEDNFFSEYPKLRDHREDVHRLAAAYRNAHPDADASRARREIAALAHVSLQIPIDQPAQAQSAPVPPPVTPTSAMAGSPAPTAQGQMSFWEELVTEEDE